MITKFHGTWISGYLFILSRTLQSPNRKKAESFLNETLRVYWPQRCIFSLLFLANDKLKGKRVLVFTGQAMFILTFVACTWLNKDLEISFEIQGRNHMHAYSQDLENLSIVRHLAQKGWCRCYFLCVNPEHVSAHWRWKKALCEKESLRK